MRNSLAFRVLVISTLLLSFNLTTGAQEPPEKEKTLAEVTADFNKESAELRQTLFDPPIRDLTEDEVRMALRRTALECRSHKLLEVAVRLEGIAETGRVPKDARFFSSGVIAEQNGKLAYRQIVPMLLLPDKPGTQRLVPLSGLNLMYYAEGQSSMDYGDSGRAKRR